MLVNLFALLPIETNVVSARLEHFLSVCFACRLLAFPITVRQIFVSEALLIASVPGAWITAAAFERLE